LLSSFYESTEMQIAPLPTRSYTQAARRKSSLGTLLLALAAGLAAACLAFLLVRGRAASAGALPPVPVVVAAADIPARTRLTAGLLGVRLLPPGDVPEGAASAPKEVLGKVSVEAIPKGAAITGSRVSAPSAGLGMAFALPPSRRAVTVATDPADGVELFVRPGDAVDILATDEPGSGPASVRTVLQNVRLLAVGSQTSPDPPPDAAPPSGSGASHVTVAVSPAQAQALVLAAARGHLHLALRAADDDATSALPALPAPPPLPIPPAPVRPRVLHRQRPPAPKALPLPPLPVSLRPLPPAHVTMTVIKGSVSQTVSVAP